MSNVTEDAARAASADAPFFVRTSHAALIVAIAKIAPPTLPRHVASALDMVEFATYVEKLTQVFNAHIFNSLYVFDRTLPGLSIDFEDFTKAVTDAAADHITGPLLKRSETAHEVT